MKNPTDGNILEMIYKEYYEDFVNFESSSPSRSSKIHVPIDCRLVAQKLKMDPELLFGRLYYHLNKKHGYTQDNGSTVNLFSLKVGDDKHAVNFPLLAAIVAEKRVSFNRFVLPLIISIIALGVSIWVFLK